MTYWGQGIEVTSLEILYLCVPNLFIHTQNSVTFNYYRERQSEVRSLPRVPTNGHCWELNPRPFNQWLGLILTRPHEPTPVSIWRFSLYATITFKTNLILQTIQAKKRQVYLEETYSGCMKELELLLDNFRLDSTPKGKTVVKTGPPTALAARKAASRFFFLLLSVLFRLSVWLSG